MRGLKQTKAELDTSKQQSHALRVRGLKLSASVSTPRARHVARSTRAWIETFPLPRRLKRTIVARSTRAWIETSWEPFWRAHRASVARSTRAWIETGFDFEYFGDMLVARSTRAWIETRSRTT